MSTSQPSMQQAFDQLAALVTEFEEGNLDLEQTIPKFKKGLELAKFLKKKLQVMENEIKEIQAEFSADTQEAAPISKKATPPPTVTVIEETIITSANQQDDLPF